MYPFTLLNDPPAPEYPQYAALLAEARRTLPTFVDPANLYPGAPILERRGPDWATAVLGYPLDMLPRRQPSRLQWQLLIAADAADVDPPMPGWIVEGRAEGERVRAERAQRRADQLAREIALWDAARAATAVTLEVHEGSRGRVRGNLYEPVRHAVPTVDAYSGDRRVRRHAAGRALCETGQARPKQLDGRVDAHATCANCLHWTTEIRPTREPTPNPSNEKVNPDV